MLSATLDTVDGNGFVAIEELPEPPPLLLFGLGIGAAGLVRRKRG